MEQAPRRPQQSQPWQSGTIAGLHVDQATGRVDRKDISGIPGTTEFAMFKPRRVALSRAAAFRQASQHYADTHMTGHGPESGAKSGAKSGRIGFGNASNQKAAQAARQAKMAARK